MSRKKRRAARRKRNAKKIRRQMMRQIEELNQGLEWALNLLRNEEGINHERMDEREEDELMFQMMEEMEMCSEGG
nr:NS4 protein [Tibet orbivirus]